MPEMAGGRDVGGSLPWVRAPPPTGGTQPASSVSVSVAGSSLQQCPVWRLTILIHGLF